MKTWPTRATATEEAIRRRRRDGWDAQGREDRASERARNSAADDLTTTVPTVQHNHHHHLPNRQQRDPHAFSHSPPLTADSFSPPQVCSFLPLPRFLFNLQSSLLFARPDCLRRTPPSSLAGQKHEAKETPTVRDKTANFSFGTEPLVPIPHPSPTGVRNALIWIAKPYLNLLFFSCSTPNKQASYSLAQTRSPSCSLCKHLLLVSLTHSMST